ncbi:TRAP transporter small permease subunit [Spirochaeta isovalerica]|uniref:TRAP-type C4-dicarboxylate transport system permease small subunit n=1 Tax=Spirochaeta isovalerica TaxID=150 RepID=A0A841RBA6_9SPIO|nr:TRAP-type C4-dicarboxylate transport system permease small subunit [Spirochaeta isovalerica]
MERFVRYIRNVELGLGAAFITIFFITIVIQVFSRYLGITVMWTGEVSTYSFTWAVFMGAGAMTYENKHFAFDSLLHHLKGKKKEILKIFISLIILIFSLATLYYGVIITQKFWNYRWINLPIKMGWTWLCVPILGGTAALYSFTHILDHIKNYRKGGMPL